MRRVLLLLALCVAGCRSRPAQSAPVPPGPRPEAFRPRHLEVLRPGLAVRPNVDAGEGHGGIALENYRVGPGAAGPQPRRDDLLPPEVKRPGEEAVAASADRPAPDARELYLQGYTLKDADPRQAARLFEQVVRVAPAGSPFSDKAKAQLERLGPR